jgi:hypothetical protein
MVHLQRQQTPNPEAQLPEAVPPRRTQKTMEPTKNTFKHLLRVPRFFKTLK